MGLVYVDANVFIAAFESEASVAAPARALFTAGRTAPHRLVTSELTIAEVLAPSSIPGRIPFATKSEIYQTVLSGNGFIQVVPVTRSVLMDTAPLRTSHRQKLPDAIHAVTALHAGCSYFCSADRDARRLPPELTAVVPDQDGLQILLNAWAS